MLVRLFLLSVAVVSGSAFCVSLKPQLAARHSLPHTAPTMVMVPLKDTEVCPHSLPMPRGFGCLLAHSGCFLTPIVRFYPITLDGWRTSSSVLSHTSRARDGSKAKAVQDKLA